MRAEAQMASYSGWEAKYVVTGTLRGEREGENVNEKVGGGGLDVIVRNLECRFDGCAEFVSLSLLFPRMLLLSP